MADDQHQGLDAILKKLSSEDATLVMKAVANTAVDAVEARIPRLFGSIREMLGLTDTVLAEVEDLTNKTGDTKEDLLLKALTLYEAAFEATQKGQRLVLVGPDYRFIQEIVGIDRVKPEAATSGSSATEAVDSYGLGSPVEPGAATSGKSA